MEVWFTIASAALAGFVIGVIYHRRWPMRATGAPKRVSAHWLVGLLLTQLATATALTTLLTVASPSIPFVTQLGVISGSVATVALVASQLSLIATQASRGVRWQAAGYWLLTIAGMAMVIGISY